MTTPLAIEPEQAPYGVVFALPVEFVDRSYYAFGEANRSLQFVLERQKLDDAATWLQQAWQRMAGYAPLPIRSYAHPSFRIQGYGLPPDPGRREPELHVLTLAWRGQFRTLMVEGAVSDAELERLLQGFAPIGAWQAPCWVALDVLVRRAPNWIPPRRFSYAAPGASLIVSWETSAEFAPLDLSPLIEEAEEIRNATADAFEIFDYGHFSVRRLEPSKLGLGPHCHVAQAVYRTMNPRGSWGLGLQLRCTGDLRLMPSLAHSWPQLLRETEAARGEWWR